MPLLGPLDQVGDQEAHDAEGEDGQHVDVPAHLLLFVDPRDPIDPDLDRPENRMQEGALPGKDPVHVSSDGFGGEQQENAVERPLNNRVADQPGRHS